MNIERIKSVYDATERSWEATAAQWMVVFDGVKASADGRVAPLEEAVWTTYRRAHELRKLMSDYWEGCLLESRERMRRDVLAAREASQADDFGNVA